MKNIFIIGSRGYKASYGGWETFVTNLIEIGRDFGELSGDGDAN